MRFIITLLLVLVVVFSYEIWYSDSGSQRVAELQQYIAQQEELNEAAQARNDAMLAEINDLKEGGQAVEELARSDQGMIKSNEIFIQVSEP